MRKVKRVKKSVFVIMLVAILGLICALSVISFNPQAQQDSINELEWDNYEYKNYSNDDLLLGSTSDSIFSYTEPLALTEPTLYNVLQG